MGVVKYVLRNRTIVQEYRILAERGLGSIIPSFPLLGAPKGRGKKSHISKAQDKAKLDVATSKQTSLYWVLIAWNAHPKVPP